ARLWFRLCQDRGTVWWDHFFASDRLTTVSFRHLAALACISEFIHGDMIRQGMTIRVTMKPTFKETQQDKMLSDSGQNTVFYGVADGQVAWLAWRFQGELFAFQCHADETWVLLCTDELITALAQGASGIFCS